MTDYMEITAAFNQARTAPDVTDRASGNGQVAAVAYAAFVELAASFEGGRIDG